MPQQVEGDTRVETTLEMAVMALGSQAAQGAAMSISKGDICDKPRLRSPRALSLKGEAVTWVGLLGGKGGTSRNRVTHTSSSSAMAIRTVPLPCSSLTQGSSAPSGQQRGLGSREFPGGELRLGSETSKTPGPVRLVLCPCGTAIEGVAGPFSLLGRKAAGL